ncbi:VOC family protein [Insolitispirillum peregrinum]|uniref:VOC family protein n=1 Tax=Insolitispirillum peregrinum TaxID=80876 RepID=UPI003613D266
MKFGYTIIYVASVASTLAFYEKAFGFKRKFLHESGDYGELETGATVLAFASLELAEANFRGACIPVKPDALPPGIELAFIAENVTQSYQTAVEAGADPVHPPAQKPWGQTIAYVRSIEGTLIELCTPVGG